MYTKSIEFKRKRFAFFQGYANAQWTRELEHVVRGRASLREPANTVRSGALLVLRGRGPFLRQDLQGKEPNLRQSHRLGGPQLLILLIVRPGVT